MTRKNGQPIRAMVRLALTSLCAALFAMPVVAQEKTLSDIAGLIGKDSRELSRENQRRLQQFRQAHSQQKQRLAALKAELEALEAEGQKLAGQFDENEIVLGDLQAQLIVEAGDFAELLGQFRTVAGEITPILSRSIISQQYLGRAEALASVSQARSLPTREQLDMLWKAMLLESVAQSEVIRFDAPVANLNDGQPVSLIRIGPFTMFAADDSRPIFTRIVQGDIARLGKQPGGRIAAGATRLARAADGDVVGAPVDPSRGDLLGLLANTPDLGQRIRQGGAPGYVVLFLLCVGLLLGGFKFVSLTLTGIAVSDSAASREASQSNALGRVFMAYESSRKDDVEALGLRLDEAIMRETPKLERGVNIIKVLAAVAPLLGLLGTVIGMIRTFTQITLVGTGDPKTMADGISQALVTTVEGLVAAIPLILLHAVLAGRARNIQQILEEQASGMVAESAESAAMRGDTAKA